MYADGGGGGQKKKKIRKTRWGKNKRTAVLCGDKMALIGGALSYY